jgi:putative sigma-54 modulation protein
MNVQVHSIRFDADSKLINFIQSKINKLDMFYNEITSTDVYLRLDKNNEEGNKVAEIKMNIPGKELFAKRQCKSFEEATDLAVEALRKQIKRTKGKQRKAG